VVHAVVTAKSKVTASRVVRLAGIPFRSYAVWRFFNRFTGVFVAFGFVHGSTSTCAEPCIGLPSGTNPHAGCIETQEIRMAVKRINAYFTGVTETDDGDFLTADSVAVISTVDEDDQYTEVLRLPASDVIPAGEFTLDVTEYDSLFNRIVDELNNSVVEYATDNGLTITGRDSADQFFWDVAPA
jgi:hypothetical protein